MNTTIIQSLVLQLPTLSLMNKECKQVLAPVLIIRLSASGIIIYLPRFVVHNPKNGYSLDIPEMYMYQGPQHMDYFINNIQDRKLILGKLLRTSIE